MTQLAMPALPEGYHPWCAKGVVTPQPALIIAGGYRCGTTSLFNYLAGHPEINPSTIKEPAYFYGPRIQQTPSPYPRGRETEAYLSMFEKRSGRVLLDGTANYLSDPGCAARIRRGLPHARIVIALRDPVARLVSWYKFLQMQGWLPETTSFPEWIRLQMTDPRPVNERPYPLQALEHGLYSSYVTEYLRVFGRERVHFVWFDDLKRDPRSAMQGLARFAGIDPAYYERYAFPAHNESMKLRRRKAFAVYRRLHRALLAPFKVSPMLHHRLRVILFGRIEPALLWLFTGPADPVDVPAHVEAELRAYYARDIPALQRALGQPVPWRAATTP